MPTQATRTVAGPVADTIPLLVMGVYDRHYKNGYLPNYTLQLGEMLDGKVCNVYAIVRGAYGLVANASGQESNGPAGP